MEKGGLSGGLEEGKALEDSSEERSERNSKESSGANAGESSGTVVFGDEMRLGLIGQVRRRWAPRGMKIRRPVELTYEWAYLNLAVDPIGGTLRWEWTSDMKAESIAPVLADWKDFIEAIVWDGAPDHQGPEHEEMDVACIQQPPHSPELQSVERIFEYLWARIEGIVYGKLEAKKKAVENQLQKLAACPEKVRSLTCWDWIEEALKESAITSLFLLKSWVAEAAIKMVTALR